MESAASPSYWSFGGAGDWSCNADAYATAANIESKGVNVVLGLGDFSYQTTADCWFDVISAIDSKMHIAIGNHDDGTTALLDQYMTHFGLTKQFYSFEYQNVHFVSISTELAIGSSSEQYNFVKSDLQKASQDSAIDWIVVIIHKPLYTSSTNHPAEVTFRNALHPLFDQYGVDVVLQGHNHNYQRTYPINYNPSNSASPIIASTESADYNNLSAPIFALVGTGGMTKYPLNDQAVYVAKQFNDSSGFLNFNVTNDGHTLVGTFFSNTDIGGQGLVRDSFTITKDFNDNESNPLAKTDFNDDGFADLVIGVPLEDIGSAKVDAGLVNVLYGGSSGLSATSPKADQIFSQDSSNVEGSSESYDFFGFATSTGDFNNDGKSDLAIGVPGEDIGTIINAGGVNVIYSSSSVGGGLSTSASPLDQFWSKQTVNIEGDTASCDFFGYSLAAGDFNKDGYDDLAVGSPSSDFGCKNGYPGSLRLISGSSGSTANNGGTVNIIYGSPSGLSATNMQQDQLLTPANFPIEGDSSNGEAESGLPFGSRLASADFNNDGYFDLAIGFSASYDPNDSTNEESGSIQLIYGSSSGLDTSTAQSLTEYSLGFAGGLDHTFGSSLAVGDFNKDGFDDLAAGANRLNVSSTEATAAGVGVVYTVYGSSAGLLSSIPSTSPAPQQWHQSSTGVEDKVEKDDNFGMSVAAGDFNNDGYRDLAIGVPYEDIGSVVDSGATNVIYGSSAGLKSASASDGTGRADQFWHQNSADINDSSESGDIFGYWLAAGDFNNDGKSDLAIGVPGEDIGTIKDSGMVNLIYGSGSGLSATIVADQAWSQNTANVDDSSETRDSLGAFVN